MRGGPEVVVVVVVGALAWTVLGLHEALDPIHDHGPGVAASASLRGWPAMVAAMMGLLVVPAVQHVADSSLRWRRPRAVIEFLVAYGGVWMAFGVVAAVAVAQLSPTTPVAPVVLAVAAVWQLLPVRQRALRACHRPVPLPPIGAPATIACLRFGLVHGRACVATCGPIMAFMAATSGSHVLWGIVLTPLALIERHSDAPSVTSRWVGLGLALLVPVAATT